ncbi:MAG: teichuronic acid exporter [Oleiphilaceae bacterium]
MNNLKQKGVTAFIWDFMGKLAIQGSSFVVTIFLARLLEPSDFGLVAIVMVVVGISQVFTDIGLSGALIQRKEVSLTHYSSVFYFNLLIATFLALLTYFLAQPIANFYNNEKLKILIEVSSILFVINALNSVQRTRLRRQLNNALISKVEFICSVISGIVGVTLALKGGGVWSLMAQIIVGSVLNACAFWMFSGWRPQLLFSFTSLAELWVFGFRMFFVSLLNAITERIDFLIIGKLLSPETLGFFQRAKSLRMLLIKYTSQSLMSVLFPVLSKIQDNLSRFQNIILKSLNLLCFITFLLMGGFYLSAEGLILFLYTDKWAASIPYLEMLLISASAYPINAVLVNVLSSRGNSKAFLRMALIKNTIFFSSLYVAFQWGIMGYLYGLIILSVVNTSISIYFVSNEIKIQKRTLWKPIVTQVLITLISVTCALSLAEYAMTTSLYKFLMTNTTFVVLFVAQNILLQTTGYKYILKEVKAIVKNKMQFP